MILVLRLYLREAFDAHGLASGTAGKVGRTGPHRDPYPVEYLPWWLLLKVGHSCL
jgi:hypothetical protein